ncbi:probable splicing factor, arginine/serine-rich 7 [Diorhabda carinulata]|uniref:probable splicing factor, arginine/serine-rich 7 n=1 Tax=Diorhabda carinulata TaxID=1163345 RepID=UPI0025A12EA0|nr:probable splicing factor, arginine/serine-rich 7 [Diorhabda carinulata]
MNTRKMTIRDTTFLGEVMDTIANFKDSKGSPPDKILGAIVSQKKVPIRNPSLQMRKALKNGLETGLLKEMNGKFKLCLSNREYSRFKNFAMMRTKQLRIREFRRRDMRLLDKRRRRDSRRRDMRLLDIRRKRDSRRRDMRLRDKRRRRGSRRRRRSQFFENDTKELHKTSNGSRLLKLAPSSINELRRRSRSKRRRRRPRVRRRSYFLKDNITMAELMDRSRRRKGRMRERLVRRRSLVEREGDENPESKEISRISSEEEPRIVKSGSRHPLVKRETEPGGNQINDNVNAHCIHSFHHDDGHYGHPPHFGREYYN